MNMKIKVSFVKARNFFIVFILVIAGFVGGYYLGVKGFRAEVTKSLQININRETPPDKNVDMSLFWQVWDILGSKYYDKTKLVPAQMVYGAISGMVSSIGDPYTLFLPPDQNKIINDNLKGNFDGVGINIGYRKGFLSVLSPLKGSPAERAGIKSGDFIVRIQDKGKNVDIDTSKEGFSLDLAVAYIRGSAGTPVILTVIRDGETKPLTFTLIREKINVPSVTLSWVGKNSDIANIKVSTFGGATLNEWDNAVSDILSKSQAKGIIIDLRNNGGGYLQDAIDIASDFVPANTTVVEQQDGKGTILPFKSDRLERLGKYKVTVLINGGSASASEILAGALRDDRGIKLIGEKSFGKGTIQEPIDFPNGAGLHVTTDKWLTPDGTWVHGEGLTPDVTVAPNENGTEDVQLNAAIGQF